MNEQATLAVVVNDDAPVVEKLTEGDVLRILWRHFADRWAPIPQVTVSPNDLLPTAGLTVVPFDGIEPPSDGTDRRIDMLLGRRAKNRANAGEYETLAIEVKVTRADFRSDIANPAKQEPWKKAATRHVYAVPAGLVQAAEVPPECGLIWVYSQPLQGSQWSHIRWVKKAPYIAGHRPQPPPRVINAIFHRLARLEAENRGYVQVAELVPGTIEEVRARALAAEQENKELRRKLATAEGRVDAWQSAYAIAAGDGLPCVICGQPIRPLRPTKHWFSSWRHVDKAHDEPCAAAELAAREADAKERYAAADTEERERVLRVAHRRAFDEAVEAEPWRAWLHRFPREVQPVIDVPTDERPGAPYVRDRVTTTP